MRNDVARKMGGKHARADHLRDSGHSYHWPWRLFWAPSSRSRDGAPEIGHGLTLLPCRTSLPRAGMSLARGFFAAALTCRRVHDETWYHERTDEHRELGLAHCTIGHHMLLTRLA